MPLTRVWLPVAHDSASRPTLASERAPAPARKADRTGGTLRAWRNARGGLGIGVWGWLIWSAGLGFGLVDSASLADCSERSARPPDGARGRPATAAGESITSTSHTAIRGVIAFGPREPRLACLGHTSRFEVFSSLMLIKMCLAYRGRNA